MAQVFRRQTREPSAGGTLSEPPSTTRRSVPAGNGKVPLTAHIIFADGQLNLPAQTPYDRQQLVEHVLGGARSKQGMRVRVDQHTWMVERAAWRHLEMCSGCARRIDHAVCRHRQGTTMVYCVACAMARPRLTIRLLSHLPVGVVLHDVQAHYAYGRQLAGWTRWPRATPPEIIDDMRLQRRFAPVLTWHCAEIESLPSSAETVGGTGSSPGVS